jgi:hypothetical protein
MDAYINRRLSDGRYRLNVSARSQPSTAVTSWYESSDFANLSGRVGSSAATAVVMASDAPVRHVAAAPSSGKKGYSESKKRKLENRDTSDGSDGGICWSDHERVPGTTAGTKGSCRPKKKKDKKKDGEASPKKDKSGD